MNTQTDDELTQSGFFSRLGGFLKRLLLAFLKLGLVLIVLGVLATIAWLIYREIDRSFDSVTRRMDINTGRIELAESDIENLLAADDIGEGQITALQTAVATQDAFIARLESDLVAGQERQEETLGELEEHVTALIASTDTISGNVTILNDGLVSLQGDLTTNVSDIDAVGGEVDALQAELVALIGELEAVQTELDDYSADEFNRMRQSLALFRVWEMVSRARLRLLEQNIGLAAAEIGTALASVDRLLVIVPEEGETTKSSLEQVQQRLILAASNLPDDQVAAARDLDTAWEVLDAALAALFGEPSTGPQETAAPVPTAIP